jgi:outer membrane receptor for ferrienterochelin and colicins
MLRTPDAWAYTTLRYAPKGPWTFSTSAVYTGSMIVPHLLDGETGFTALVRTPNFFEHNLKAAYTMPARSGSRWELFAGVQNLWNSFQRDFVMGPERDAGYMYGPLRPRTVYAGARLRWTK